MDDIGERIRALLGRREIRRECGVHDESRDNPSRRNHRESGALGIMALLRDISIRQPVDEGSGRRWLVAFDDPRDAEAVDDAGRVQLARSPTPPASERD